MMPTSLAAPLALPYKRHEQLENKSQPNNTGRYQHKHRMELPLKGTLLKAR